MSCGRAPSAAKLGGEFENVAILVAIAVNEDGYREVLGTAYTYANFHSEFIRGHVTLIDCPKLDEGDYAEKLTQIIAGNNIKGVTVVRMEVPCCGGIENAVKRALQENGKFISWNVVTIFLDR